MRNQNIYGMELLSGLTFASVPSCIAQQEENDEWKRAVKSGFFISTPVIAFMAIEPLDFPVKLDDLAAEN